MRRCYAMSCMYMYLPDLGNDYFNRDQLASFHPYYVEENWKHLNGQIIINTFYYMRDGS